MSADLAARLRALAQDYHDGRINLAAYRSLRAPLLDSLVMNVPRSADPMAITQPRVIARAGQPAPPAAEPPAEEQGRKVPVGLITLVVGLLAIVVTTVWFVQTRPAGLGGRAADAASMTSAHPAYAAVEPFLERGEWSDARLSELDAALRGMGEERLAEVAHEQWFMRFVDEVRSRLKEHQALSAQPLTADRSPLAALAVTVGLDLNSPDAAIHIAAIPSSGGLADEAAHATASAGVHARADARAGGRTNGGASVPVGAEPGPGALAHETPDARASGSSSGVQPGAHGSSTQDSTAHPDRAAVAGAAASSTSASTGAADSGHRVASASVSGAANTSAGAASAGHTDANACRRELIRSRRPLCQDTLPGGTPGPLLALIPAGSFDMGSSADPTEQPVHRVTIHEPFAISVYEVSQGEFALYCTHTRRQCAAQPWTSDDYPVVNVSWDDAQGYVEWLSSVTHQRYRLPTEAQWEYAARAGQTGLVPSGDALSPTDAHFSMLTKQTAAVPRSRKFNQNAFRLVHTVGNVREWVEDGWRDTLASAPADGSAVPVAADMLRVARGGSYVDTATKLRLSTREGIPQATRDVLTGFRVVRELP